ncbi:hypothetical protein TTHT_0146 [Thermotomaculum hydrothermale]|uniref:Uncharacterized protein n=1 Tax=Thermotomaculum hydrothermale TaxID=981385 RepID=A0A7R6PDK8_9BACT|nr:hypothetical protein [Thermotomaculum hydrothermale]BBB31788.1 hypothetical protein TTHT_0146 [Thermotomaculum hydrothermale]
MKRLKQFLMVLIAFFVLFSLKAQTLREQVKSLYSPEVYGKIQSTNFKLGDLTVTSESIFGVKALNKKCGIIINNGEFKLKIKNKYCIPVVKRNTKRFHISTTNSIGELTITKKFDNAYILTTNDLGATTPLQSDIKLPESLKKFIVENPFIDPAIDFTGAKLQNNDITVAVFETTLGYFYYVFDPDDTESEQLFYLRKSKYIDYYEMYEIAYQPYEREVYELTAPDFSVTHIDLNVVNTQKDLVTIDAKLTITAETTLNGLTFDLVNSYYTLNTNTGRISGSKELKVDSLKINGEDSDYIHYSHKLLVKLPQGAKKGDKIVLYTRLSGDILHRLFGDNFWQLDNYAWYPKAKLKEEHATIHIKATVPDNFTVFASGDTVSFKKKDGYKTIETKLDYPIQRPLISAGKYFIHKKKALGRSCIVATHGTKKDKNSKRLLNYFFAASDIIERGVNKPYPFKDQYIIETNFDRYYTGPSIIYVGSEIFNPKYETIDDLNLLFINDIARAYFRFRLNLPNENEFWISEGFSQYIAAITYTQLFRKRKVAQKKFIRILRKWKRGAELVKSGDSIYLASHLCGKKSKDIYDMVHLYYDKAPLVLHALRLEMQKKYGAQNGDRMFFVWISSILKSFSGRYVNTYDCIRLLNMITRDNWQPFFDKYIFGTETPDINI